MAKSNSAQSRMGRILNVKINTPYSTWQNMEYKRINGTGITWFAFRTWLWTYGGAMVGTRATEDVRSEFQ